jgi:2'-5' RNA ligase
VRAFVAVWPPAPVLGALRGLVGPPHPDVRWTPETGWHVTLAFLGDVDVCRIPEFTRALVATGSRCGPVTAVLGPATERAGPGLLWLPVGGLDPLAGAVRANLGPLAHHGGDQAFRGHLTVARSRGRRRLPPDLAGVPLSANWEVGRISLVASHPGPGGSRYEIVGRARLGPP